MKKYLMIIAASLFLMNNALAQNSTVEAIEYDTEAEKFINEVSFLRVDTYLEMEEDGIEAWARVATDLTSNKKIGYCYFMTESKQAGAAWAAIGSAIATKGAASYSYDGSSKPLGYLDMNQLDDMITALNSIVAITKTKTPNKYTLTFNTVNGITITYNSEENNVVYSKKWYYINEYGVKTSFWVTSPSASMKAVTEAIKMLEKAKTIINQNL